MEQYRQPKIERYKQIWVDRESHELLRQQKKKQKKSITEIACEDIKEKYKL